MHWRVDALRQTLQPLAWPSSELSIEVLAQIGSTNTALLDRVRGGDASPCLLVAEAQTAGRGRLGRAWWAAPGASLTFSLGLPYAPTDWSGLSLAVGLAVAEALDPGNAHIGLKWPNDLWLRATAAQPERKLGGILIETTTWPGGDVAARSDEPARRYAVIGVGLNITQAPGEDAALRPKFASGHAGVQALDAALEAPAVLHLVAPALLRVLRRFEADGLAPLRTRYQARDVLLGREVQAGDVRGTAAGIDAQGQLLVQTQAGITAVGSGEVSVRPC